MNAYSRDLESDEILLRSAVVAYNDLLQGKEGATEPQLTGLRAANGVVMATSDDSVCVSRAMTVPANANALHDPAPSKHG